MQKFEQLIHTIFPFHVRTDRSLVVKALGASAEKLIPRSAVGRSMVDLVTVVSPRIPLKVERLTKQLNSTLLCRLRDSEVLLRGQLVEDPDAGGFTFLWSPWLENPKQLEQFNLKETDFSPFESSIEHLYLTFTRAEQLRELQVSNERLQATIRESEQLAAAEAALTRDLEVAADIRLHIVDGALATAQVNATDLQPLTKELVQGQKLVDTPTWLQHAVTDALRGTEKKSYATRVNVVIDDTQRALDLRVSRVSERELILLGRDTSEREREHMLLLRTLENALEAVIMIDDERRLSFFNRAAQELFGYTAEEAIGRGPELLTTPLTSTDEETASFWLPDSDSGRNRYESTFYCKSGAALTCTYTVSRVTVGDQEIVAAFIQDVTAEREAERQISFQANHDPLTGLSNRRHFMNQLNEQMEAGHTSTLALALIDMDDFKSINDLLGHGAGDEFLKATAQRLSDVIRDNDIACRLGGDEFALLLTGITDDTVAETVVRRLIDNIHRPLHIDGYDWEPSASIGIALGAPGSNSSELLRNADLAMYEAKAQGKGKLHFYTDQLAERATQRIEKQRRLERALGDGEIIAYFQPIVDLRTGRPESFEALARWRKTSGQVLPPSEFIEIAETSDLIIKLEHQILDQALTLVATIRRRHLEQRNASVSVNVSPRHFSDPRLATKILRLLEAHQLPGDALTIELTENILLKESETVRNQFRELRSMGIRIALDDFGTGYSSLSYLNRYHFDLIKIDRSFVQDLIGNQRRARLLEIMIAVGNAMDARVVAEGIETHEDERFLQEIECHLGQGYLYARPMPADATEVFLLGDMTAGHRLETAAT